MSVVPAAPYLVDFSAKDIASEVGEESPRPSSTVGGDSDWAERVEEAHARGIEEGRKAAEAETIARLEEQKAALEQSLATARMSWCEEQGPRIAEQIGMAVRDLEDRIAESVERVLRPFLAEAARDEAIRQLRAIVEELIATNPGITLEISAPEDLLSTVRASLSASVVTVSYVVNEACDVQLKAGASIIETRIAAWLKYSEGQVA
ncbi:MAG: hypothetical protein K8F92_10785 [Hyphomicrobium sp.]|uniref:hypothetical protein n=1 Tax=Hyphomicrobium sp. TaxID=82 RepID=UPI00132B6420|nr:hypothetical protein [Hyphomicrobium sp.]KAB2943233.1 MAG: hypothetical protein F9K20_04290 [Hyphomicrobium sp.]MBZ0210123.1 hypothetical protein [Hyphomicrobium sp.]